jgi:hypothetical protein
MKTVGARPVVFGYQRAHLGASDEQVQAGQRALETFAEREGLRLLHVYVDANANHPYERLFRMLRAVRETGAAAVAVPTAGDLGGTAFVRSVTRSMIQREIGVPVLVVEETPATPEVLRGGAR